MIAPRKPAASLPVVTVPDSDWEPWNEASATSLQEPLYPEPEQPVHHDRQVTVPQKKYDHLPLVADEMRKGGGGGAPHQHSTEILNIPARKKTGTQKKGVLGFMKK
jgi:hypothetical protein